MQNATAGCYCCCLGVCGHRSPEPCFLPPFPLPPSQRLVECAYLNMSRIRFIWVKLWSVISAHLVAGSCHINRHVALLSVHSLRGLSARLLSRSELAHFTYQVLSLLT